MIDPAEQKELADTIQKHGKVISPELEKKLDEQLEEIVAADIHPDATLQDIKAKQAELISKQRKSFKKMMLLKREQCYLERLAIAADAHYREMVDNENRTLGKVQQLDKDGKATKIRKLVSADVARGTLNIYDKIAVMENRIGTYEAAMKTNDKIADRVENMLNAQINIDKRSQ